MRNGKRARRRETQSATKEEGRRWKLNARGTGARGHAVVEWLWSPAHAIRGSWTMIYETRRDAPLCAKVQTCQSQSWCRWDIGSLSSSQLPSRCIDATSPCSREHLSEVCMLSSPSLLLLLTSSPFLVAWSVPYTPRFFSAPRHRNRISVTRRPWVVGMPLCPKVPFLPLPLLFPSGFPPRFKSPR